MRPHRRIGRPVVAVGLPPELPPQGNPFDPLEHETVQQPAIVPQYPVLVVNQALVHKLLDIDGALPCLPAVIIRHQSTHSTLATAPVLSTSLSKGIRRNHVMSEAMMELLVVARGWCTSIQVSMSLSDPHSRHEAARSKVKLLA